MNLHGSFYSVLWLVHLNGRGKKLKEARNRAGAGQGKGIGRGILKRNGNEIRGMGR